MPLRFFVYQNMSFSKKTAAQWQPFSDGYEI